MGESANAGRKAIKQAIALARLADQSSKQGRFDEAAERFRQALALAPRMPELHYKL